MKSILIIIISFLFLFVFSTCKKEKSCAGFNPDDLTEFSYKTIDTLVFMDVDSNLFYIYISAINLSEPYTYKCKDLYKTCPCINYVEALATDSRSTTEYIFLKMEQSDVSEMQYFKYNVQGFEFEFDFINELPYIDQMEHLQHFQTMTIGNYVYDNVIEVTNLNLSTANIYKVYFNKQNGLLRFSEKTTNKVWTLR